MNRGFRAIRLPMQADRIETRQFSDLKEKPGSAAYIGQMTLLYSVERPELGRESNSELARHANQIPTAEAPPARLETTALAHTSPAHGQAPDGFGC